MTDEKRKEIKNAYAILSRAVNVMGSHEELATALYEEITADHRTLQQSFFNMFRKVMAKYGEQKDCWTDARNIGARDFCKKASEVEAYMPLV